MTNTSTIKAGQDKAGSTAAGGCKFAEAKDTYDESDAAINVKKATAMQSAHDMAGDEYFTSKIGTNLATTITAGVQDKNSYN